MIYVKVPIFLHSSRKNSRVSDAKHPIELIQLFDFTLKVKYFQVFRERGALRACNCARDCAREELIFREN